MQWSTLDPEILSAYSHAYQLNTPPAFISDYNQLLLTGPGIGRFSPTMARRREKRRQSKDQLSNTVRKHFNGLGIQENEAIVEFLYKVKWQGKLQFASREVGALIRVQTKTFACDLHQTSHDEQGNAANTQPSIREPIDFILRVH